LSIAWGISGALLGAVGFGPIDFVKPAWLWLIPLAWGLTLWLSRKSIAGLAPGARRWAIGFRLLVIALLVAAMAQPRWKEESESVGVAVVLDVSRSVPQDLQQQAEEWVNEAAEEHKGRQDRLGLVTVADDPIVQLLLRDRNQALQKTDLGRTEASDIAAGVTTSMAIAPTDAALRIVLISDGNETEGSLLRAAQQAKAEGHPIDVLPIQYTVRREVIVDELVAPATARLGETINVRAVLTSKSPTPARGILTIQLNDETIDLDPDESGLGMLVELEPGLNVFTIPLAVPAAGPQEFSATFDPLPDDEGVLADTIVENNRAESVTFVSGRGAVLVLSQTTEDSQHYVRALRESDIAFELRHPDDAPQSLTQWNAFDAVILINTSVYHFSQAQQEELVQYVHDSGGGLMMIGGPTAFGAGGWIQSPVAEVFPVRMDPPEKRQMPRGALVLVMHSVEMDRGVYWGKETSKAAIKGLSRLDLAGIVEHSPMSMQGTRWAHPIAEIGDRTAINRSIDSLEYGDMPSFDPPLRKALEGLQNVEAGAKHVIVISDGDPSLSRRILQQFRKARITISAVGVFPHSPRDLQSMKDMAEITDGEYYAITTQGQLASVPEIFFKEAQRVRRALIWEGPPLIPAITGMPSEPMRGISSTPPITGYVVTGDRGGHAIVTMRGKENDPIAAHWQFGLGRSVAITTDATSKWAANWMGWPGFKQFWEQHTRWVMRPSGDANIRVTTRNEGERTRIIVDATDPSGKRLNFAQWQGRVAKSDGEGVDVQLRQVGPGRYEGAFDSSDPGSYIISMRYAAPGEEGRPIEGSVQAAVSRPFADEFRALEDNTPLLRQVAEMTGGRVLTADPRQTNLWTRQGLTMPVAATPIWLATALIALILFLVDVAVRRVRIDLGVIRGMALRAFSTSTKQAGEQLDSLRTARAKAQQSMAARAKAKQVAARKFEASEDSGVSADASPLTADRPVAEIATKPKRTPEPTNGDKEEEAGMSRLMKAKKRAREGFTEEDEL